MEPSPPTMPTPQSRSNAAPPRAVVAVLDDDIRFIRMVERVLREENIAVHPVTTLDLDEAVAVVAAERCDLALVDVFMYDNAAGFDLVERLRACPATSRLPLVVSSGARREVARRIEFLREHQCALLLKPFTPDELIATVRQHLAAPALAHSPAETVGAPSRTPASIVPAVMSHRFAARAEACAPSAD